MRAFFTPTWLGRHALLLVTLAVLARIGWWQWDKASTGPGSWQNYGYGVQWWLFAGFAVFLWVKVVLDELDPSRVEARTPPPPAPLEQPKAAPPADDEDDELAAYNRYLAQLDQRGSGR